MELIQQRLNIGFAAIVKGRAGNAESKKAYRWWWWCYKKRLDLFDLGRAEKFWLWNVGMPRSGIAKMLSDWAFDGLADGSSWWPVEQPKTDFVLKR